MKQLCSMYVLVLCKMWLVLFVINTLTSSLVYSLSLLPPKAAWTDHVIRACSLIKLNRDHMSKLVHLWFVMIQHGENKWWVVLKYRNSWLMYITTQHCYCSFSLSCFCVLYSFIFSLKLKVSCFETVVAWD